VASQARAQSWLTPLLRCPPPPPLHHSTRRPEHMSQLCPFFSHAQYSAMPSPAESFGNRHRIGMGGVGTRFLRTGYTVLWQLSQNLVGSEFTIPRPLPFAVHEGTVAARVDSIKYCQVAEKGELSVKTRYSCSTSTPVLELIHAPRHGCPNAACRNRAKTSLRETKSSHAHVEHLHTFAYGHLHYGPVHHRRRFHRRF